MQAQTKSYFLTNSLGPRDGKINKGYFAFNAPGTGVIIQLQDLYGGLKIWLDGGLENHFRIPSEQH